MGEGSPPCGEGANEERLKIIRSSITRETTVFFRWDSVFTHVPSIAVRLNYAAIQVGGYSIRRIETIICGSRIFDIAGWSRNFRKFLLMRI